MREQEQYVSTNNTMREQEQYDSTNNTMDNSNNITLDDVRIMLSTAQRKLAQDEGRYWNPRI